MKMKMFTMLFALSVGATATFAQKGVEDGSRFGHGQDSIRCLQNISIYTEYVKTENFKDAYTPWKAVFTEAPFAQVGTYTNGAKILRALIASSKDGKQQKAYLDNCFPLPYEIHWQNQPRTHSSLLLCSQPVLILFLLRHGLSPSEKPNHHLSEKNNSESSRYWNCKDLHRHHYLHGNLPNEYDLSKPDHNTEVQ